MRKSFNPRPCGRGDPGRHGPAFAPGGFNPRPCGRGDSGLAAHPAPAKAFQSTPLWEGRRICAPTTPSAYPFQSTPLWEGRRYKRGLWLVYVESFNPRPCGRGDYDLCYKCEDKLRFQSTPLWEGRRPAMKYLTALNTFQSTPLWEGRRAQLVLGHMNIRFNPRPCGRGDGIIAHRVPLSNIVSIHAPVGGATFGSQPSVSANAVSIHAPVGGATGVLDGAAQLAPVSIHAPVGGATGRRPALGKGDMVSIHAPVGGATLFWDTCFPYSGCFNPRPCGRGDGLCPRIPLGLSAFQSTPLWEGRPCFGIRAFRILVVSIHAPVGGATGCVRVSPLA